MQMQVCTGLRNVILVFQEGSTKTVRCGMTDGLVWEGALLAVEWR